MTAATTQKSWMHDAAYEILTSPGANIDAVAAIIAKHCPVKKEDIPKPAVTK